MSHLKITNHRGEVIVNQLVDDLEVRGNQVKWTVDLDTTQVTLSVGARVEVGWETT